mgnify:CR=1 FL=1
MTNEQQALADMPIWLVILLAVVGGVSGEMWRADKEGARGWSLVRRLALRSGACMVCGVSALMLCYAAAFALLAMVGAMVGLGLAWYLGLLVACVLAAYHYTLIRGRERAPCFKAFRHNNWVGGVIFAGLAVDLLVR